MSTVAPKLIYSRSKSVDIPVWEITTEFGHKIYYERIYYPGLRAIGINDKLQLHNSTINICDLVRYESNNIPRILKAKDGYIAPMSWYEVDVNYKGVLPRVEHSGSNSVIDIPDSDGQSDNDCD